jgi:hypothetical protein
VGWEHLLFCQASLWPNDDTLKRDERGKPAPTEGSPLQFDGAFQGLQYDYINWVDVLQSYGLFGGGALVELCAARVAGAC